MNPASAAQKRKIFALAKKNGMDNDLLHAYVCALVKKESLSKLTILEAIQIIDGLSGKGTRSPRPRTDGMSQAQRGYLLSLAKRVGWVDEEGQPDEERLNGFCRKQQDTLYWTGLTRSKACKVIEALKAMAERRDEDERGRKATIGND